MNQVRSQVKRKDGVALNIAVLPELRCLLKANAAIKGQSMVERLHEILCEALDQPELIDKPPASAVRR